MPVIDSAIPQLLGTLSSWASRFNVLLVDAQGGATLLQYIVNVAAALSALGVALAVIASLVRSRGSSLGHSRDSAGWGVSYRGGMYRAPRDRVGGLVYRSIRSKNREHERTSGRGLFRSILSNGLIAGAASWVKDRVVAGRERRRNEEITGLDRKTEDQLDVTLGKATIEENNRKADAVDADTNRMLDSALASAKQGEGG